MVIITDGLEVVNDYCHKCKEIGLLQFNGTIDKRQCAHMICARCGKKEYRKTHQVKAA